MTDEQTLTTTEALEYIATNAINKRTGEKRYNDGVYPQQLNRWKNAYHWIEPVGKRGNQYTYTVQSLDALIDKINTNYRMKRKP
jgi:hypothetical protein